ncbi:MAG: WD40 repeat domain-containing protein, partial [Nanoarchaeota archaeon]
YEVQPEQNPIDPHLAVGFHPQPSKIFLDAGEEQPIVGFEVPPHVPAGRDEISYTRTFTIRPIKLNNAPTKQAAITTIINKDPLNEDAKVLGKILDAQTGQPIGTAKIFLKHKRFEGRAMASPSGDYSLNLPSLQYLMLVQAPGYELFSEDVNLNGGDEIKKEIPLNKAKEKGSYTLIKEAQLEPGAWEGVWRSAVSNDGKYFAFGMGGVNIKQGTLEGYFYLFDNLGNEILKIKTADEVRGIDISPDGSLIAVGIGSTRQRDSPPSGQQYEKVLVYRKTGELVWKKFPKDNAFHEVKFSRDGKYLAVGDAEGYLYLLNAVDGAEIWNKFTRGQVRAIKFYDDGSSLLVGNGEGYIYLFDINGNKKWKTYVHSWPYGFIASTPGNGFSAAGGHMGYLHLLDKDG